MANKRTTIVITHATETLQTIKDLLNRFIGTKPRQEAVLVSRFFSGASIGNRSCFFTTQSDNNDAVKASGTFTFSAAASTSDTVLINGVTFTAVASGPTNNQFVPGGTATTTAAALAAAINTSSTALINQNVTASPLAGVVTVTSMHSSPSGNQTTIAKGVDAGSVNTVSGARLTGGAFATGIYGPYTNHLGL